MTPREELRFLAMSPKTLRNRLYGYSATAVLGAVLGVQTGYSIFGTGMSLVLVLTGCVLTTTSLYIGCFMVFTILDRAIEYSIPLPGSLCGEALEVFESHEDLRQFRKQVIDSGRRFTKADLSAANRYLAFLRNEEQCKKLHDICTELHKGTPV